MKISSTKINCKELQVCKVRVKPYPNFYWAVTFTFRFMKIPELINEGTENEGLGSH